MGKTALRHEISQQRVPAEAPCLTTVRRVRPSARHQLQLTLTSGHCCYESLVANERRTRKKSSQVHNDVASPQSERSPPRHTQFFQDCVESIRYKFFHRRNTPASQREVILRRPLRLSPHITRPLEKIASVHGIHLFTKSL